jgi:hypothetical protein
VVSDRPLTAAAGDDALAAACTANAGAVGELALGYGYGDAVAERLPWVHRYRGPVPSHLWKAVT